MTAPVTAPNAVTSTPVTPTVHRATTRLVTGMVDATPAATHRHRRPLRPPVDAVRELARLTSTHAIPAARRAAERALGRGAEGAPITTGPDQTVLLFYEDVERDRFVSGDRHARRALRRVYHALTTGQQVSGFEVAFGLLCTALRRAGCRVVVNNYALARRHPEHPVGVCGYPHALDRWRLPNPAVLGPGLYDHPAEAPRLMDDARFRSYLVPCEWMRDVFAPAYDGPGGDRVRLWFGGIDTDAWPDLSASPKDIDVLVYDKIRWNRALYERVLLAPALAELRRRGLRARVLERGAYEVNEYRALLARSRAMLFLCEHETQGLAYQEAMASGVPVLAWDNGHWLDPNRPRWSGAAVPASSVPFFGPECGERFRDADALPAALDRLIDGVARGTYAPRAYVERELSTPRSAELYLRAYVAAAR